MSTEEIVQRTRLLDSEIKVGLTRVSRLGNLSLKLSLLSRVPTNYIGRLCDSGPLSVLYISM